MFAAVSLVLLAGATLSGPLRPDGGGAGQPAPAAPAMNASGTSAFTPNPQPPTIAQALNSGVLIVISKASQRMQVFKDGEPWLTTPVSTGRRGHRTPSGVFPILEKQQFHRSNIYSNAPMPFMQRLTRGGIAIHAGHLPGYPASHGCIRVAYGVARSLFSLTRASHTTVVIIDEPMQSDDQARRLALAVQQPQPEQAAQPALALASAPLPSEVTPPPPPAMPVADAQPRLPSAGQTIQLAAALSPQEAEARWSWLVSFHAELGGFDRSVIPVVVGPHRYFRLRASGPGAFATCSQLKSAGVDCFKVL